MSIRQSFRATIAATYVGHITQAIVNNFAPLLFVTFSTVWGIPLDRILILVSVNFGVQLVVDLLCAAFMDQWGYRVPIILSQVFAAVGLTGLGLFPYLFSDPFVGLALAVGVYAVGGGLTEVLISPIVQACPTENKEAHMNLLHSFYCWGHVAVVLLSTAFFYTVGIEHWRVLALLWCLVPAADFLLFTKVPIAPLLAEGETGMTFRDLAKQKLFWMLMVMMVCAGASEQAVSQWASTFAEQGLGVSKTLGDLMGPMFFAICMGTARAIYGKFGDRLDLKKFMGCSTALCIAAYLIIAFVPNPLIALLGCGIGGFSVGIFWPGTFSLASAGLKTGGTLMFALLALAGDLGCGGGPTFAGKMAELAGDNLRFGIGAALIFPVMMGILLLAGKSSRQT